RRARWLREGPQPLFRRPGGGAGGLSEAQEIRHQPERAIGAGRQLAPQAQADVDPASLADFGFDERAALGSLVVRERLLELEQGLDVRIAILGVEEVEPAFLDPARTVRSSELVWCVEHRILWFEQSHFGVLVGHALAADLPWIRRVLRVIELELVV